MKTWPVRSFFFLFGFEQPKLWLFGIGPNPRVEFDTARVRICAVLATGPNGSEKGPKSNQDQPSRLKALSLSEWQSYFPGPVFFARSKGKITTFRYTPLISIVQFLSSDDDGWEIGRVQIGWNLRYGLHIYEYAMWYKLLFSIKFISFHFIY